MDIVSCGIDWRLYLNTYIKSIKQRKLDNTFKMLEFLRKHITDKQISVFIDLFHANNELSGVKYNEFRLTNGRIDTIETMFSEGGCGNEDIHNMIELFNLISSTLSQLEISVIWFEYGQMMSKIYQWTKYLEDIGSNTNNKSFYSNFNIFMKKNHTKLLFAPHKYYTYAE